MLSRWSPAILFQLCFCLMPIQAADLSGKTLKLDELADRSPVSLALIDGGKRLLTANQTSGSVSLVDISTGKVLHEIATGNKPAGIAASRDGKSVVVTHWYGYDAAIVAIEGNKLSVVGRVEVGPEPRGVAISPDGKMAYVAVGVANEVVGVEIAGQKVAGRVAVGLEPRNVAITPDGKTLVVCNARSQNISLIDLASFKKLRDLDISGDNLRQTVISPDGQYAYLVNMKNRGFATTRNNIDIGWVLGQRITRVPISAGSDGVYETISLDPQGDAAADVYGVALGGDGKYMAVSSSGTHEIFLFRQDQETLPWRPNGSRDLMAAELIRDKKRLKRINVGGRPMEMQFGPDGKTLFIANYFGNSVQVMDAEKGAVVSTIALGGPEKPGQVRQGEMLFFDAEWSFNKWYSCATCHSDGHTNGLDFDTMNDGWHDFSTRHDKSRKKVPTMRRVAFTAPWTWHGWQKSLDEAMIESFTKSMQGNEPSDEQVKAIVAYITSLDFPPNPFRNKDGSLTEAAQRGKKVFESAKAACNKCHSGPELTDGKIYDVGLDEPGSRYQGHNPPSLRGVYDKYPYLHDGRAKTLTDALKGAHSPENVTGLGELSEQELKDLVEYVKSL